MRRSGVLLHISSLPSKYMIGDFGHEAYRFIDLLEASKQSLWQILPIGPTSYGDSPYQSFSSYALNPYFISLETLKNEGLLTDDDLIDIKNDSKVDYGYLYETRYDVLKKAYYKFNFNQEAYHNFISENAYWLNDYALFMAIKKHFNDQSWINWPDDLRFRKAEALQHFQEMLAEEITFQKYMQFEASKQWFLLKAYANAHGIDIVGDMPIYVAYDSADVWSQPLNFKLDQNRHLSHVAGVPPDAFTEDGQLWGNPLYDWDYLKQTGYEFWVSRMKVAVIRFDQIRIDHFIGFANYYQIKAHETTAKNGIWVKGPGYDLFKVLDEKLGKFKIIAEDLGVVTNEVLKLLEQTGFPGMKLLQFAFGGESENPNLTHNHIRNQIIYTGTHDNDTTKGWLENLSKDEVDYIKSYINETDDRSLVSSLIKEALSSVADTVIIPMQDYLHLGSEARMNYPSRVGNYWTWRMDLKAYNQDIVDFMASNINLYGRSFLKK